MKPADDLRLGRGQDARQQLAGCRLTSVRTAVEQCHTPVGRSLDDVLRLPLSDRRRELLQGRLAAVGAVGGIGEAQIVGQGLVGRQPQALFQMLHLAVLVPCGVKNEHVALCDGLALGRDRLGDAGMRRRHVDRRRNGRKRDRPRDRLRVADEVTPQKQQRQQNEDQRDAPAHDPRRHRADDLVGLFAVCTVVKRHISSPIRVGF